MREGERRTMTRWLKYLQILEIQELKSSIKNLSKSKISNSKRNTFTMKSKSNCFSRQWKMEGTIVLKEETNKARLKILQWILDHHHMIKSIKALDTNSSAVMLEKHLFYLNFIYTSQYYSHYSFKS